MDEHICHKCGEPAQDDTDPQYPLCADCMMQAGGGNDPSTAEEE